MPSRASTPPLARKPKALRNFSPEALEAARHFKGMKAPPTPRRLQGRHAAAIRRAVHGYYFG